MSQNKKYSPEEKEMMIKILKAFCKALKRNIKKEKK